MIYAEGCDRWFGDLGEFLDWCEDQGQPPSSWRPYIAEFTAAEAPDLAEAITDEMYDDWEPDQWLVDLQKVVDEAFAKADEGAYWPTKYVPILPDEAAAPQAGAA